jgi:hypothetical protein
MHVLCPAAATLLLQSATHELDPSAVEPAARLVRAAHPDHDGRIVGHGAELRFIDNSTLGIDDRDIDIGRLQLYEPGGNIADESLELDSSSSERRCSVSRESAR